MKYDEYFKIICESMPKDWHYDDDSGIYLYKDNMDISIENDINWLKDSDDTCYEEWAKKFNNNHAYKKRFILKYQNKTVQTLYGVYVDACKCFIPSPDKEMIITQVQYGIGRIINGCIISYEEFDSYLLKTNIKVM